MANTKVDEALVEIAAALDVIEPQIEGMDDLLHIDLKPEAVNDVTLQKAEYDRRHMLLITAQTSLTALVADRYPLVPIREVTDTVMTDLQTNLSTFEAAIKQFLSNAATDLGLAAGEAENK